MNIAKVAGRVMSADMQKCTRVVAKANGRFELYNGEEFVKSYTSSGKTTILAEIKNIFSRILDKKERYLYCDIAHPYDSAIEAAAGFRWIPGDYKALTGFYGDSFYKIKKDGTFMVQKWMKGRCPDSSICVVRNGHTENGRKVFSKDYKVIEFIPKKEIVTKYTDGGSTKTITQRKMKNGENIVTTTTYKRSQTTGNWEEVK